MRTTIDFTPLFRSGIGFDRVLDALQASDRVEAPDNWPPYDIVKMDEDRYRIEMAVAGLSDSDLEVTQEGGTLLVSGGRDAAEDAGRYLHRGIAWRRFELADHVSVEGAQLNNGLLTIELKREIPEELKPRRIEISDTTALPKQEAAETEAEPAAA